MYVRQWRACIYKCYFFPFGIANILTSTSADLKPGVRGVAGLAVAPAHVEVALYLHGCTKGQALNNGKFASHFGLCFSCGSCSVEHE